MALTTVSPGLLDTTAQYYGFKNRIMNGAMAIDQRNAGASVTPTNGQYTLDRYFSSLTQASKFTVQQNAGSVTPPTGFTNYLGVTSSSAYSVLTGDLFGIGQRIEGFNTADFSWGTASAATVTLSFWARSSLTGTFGGSLYNNSGNRYYVFSFTINTANTWEQKTITITGDTAGTWLTNSSSGIQVFFNLGAGSSFQGSAGSWSGSLLYAPTGATSVVGTNGATFYITGVQLEKGSTATSFDYREYGRELIMCQRYYQKSYPVDVTPGSTSDSLVQGITISGYSATRARGGLRFPVQMRAAPTMLTYNLFAGGSGQGYNFTVDNTIASGVTAVSATASGFAEILTPTLTTGSIVGVNYTASAEL